MVEAEWAGGDHITGANDQDRFILMGIGDPHHLAMPRGYSALVATLQHGMRGDEGAALHHVFDGDVLTEYLNPASEVFFASAASADLVIAGAR